MYFLFIFFIPSCSVVGLFCQAWIYLLVFSHSLLLSLSFFLPFSQSLSLSLCVYDCAYNLSKRHAAVVVTVKTNIFFLVKFTWIAFDVNGGFVFSLRKRKMNKIKIKKNCTLTTHSKSLDSQTQTQPQLYKIRCSFEARIFIIIYMKVERVEGK